MTMTFDAPATLDGPVFRVQKNDLQRPLRHDKAAVKDYWAGRWPECFSIVLGLDESLFDGSGHPCPKCGGSDRFSLIDDQDGACHCRHCFSEDCGDGLAFIMHMTGKPFNEATNLAGDAANLSPMPPATDEVKTSFEQPVKPIKEPEAIPDDLADLRHAINKELPGLFPLSQKHRSDLLSRGFTDEAIIHYGYWTYNKANQGTKLLTLKAKAPKTKDASGAEKPVNIGETVPGVMYKSLEINAANLALMIPVRDLQGRVVGHQYRNDKPKKDSKSKYLWVSSKSKGGPASGAPCHASLPPETEYDKSIVRITEGQFKSDLATLKTGVRTIAIAGVDNWKSAVPFVHAIGAKIVRLALDADASINRGVAKAVISLYDTFSVAGSEIAVEVETWKNGKGIDDALDLGETIAVLSAIESKKHIDSLREFLGQSHEAPDVLPFESLLDPARLARINLKSYADKHDGQLKFWQGAWWRYKNGWWRQLTDDEIDAKLRVGMDAELLRIAMNEEPDDDGKQPQKKAITNQMVSNVLSATKAQCLLSSQIEMPCWLPEPRLKRNLLTLENGILDIDRVAAGEDPTACFMPHTPDWFAITRLDYAFDPSARSMTWARYLESSLPDESSRLLAQEWSGYQLTTSNPFQKFFAGEGEGGSGKSVYAAGNTALLGEASVSNAELKEFGTPFGLGKTIGKALNIDSDVQQDAKFSEGAFKKYAVGERMDFQLKGGDPFTQAPTAKLMLLWNNRPYIKDSSNGFWRRMLLVSFDRVIPVSERVYGMDTAAWWRNTGELPGMLNWAIEGLQRLFRQGGFTESEAMTRRIRQFKTDQNPVQEFIDEMVTYNPASHHIQSTAGIVASFKNWCTDSASASDAEKMDSRQMGRLIAKTFNIESEIFIEHATDSKETRRRGFRGIFLKDFEERKEKQKSFDAMRA